jgi:hypothetical protein
MLEGHRYPAQAFSHAVDPVVVAVPVNDPHDIPAARVAIAWRPEVLRDVQFAGGAMSDPDADLIKPCIV